MRGRLLIFCGIPGSGKTTIARLVAAELPNAIHIQTDAVRWMLSHPNFGGKESKFVYHGCFAVAREALKSGYVVLLDGTFMREEYRREARRALRKHCARVDVVHVDCSLGTALKRNSSRGRVVPPEKLANIHRRFEPPARAVRVDSSRLQPRVASRRVLKALF